VYQNCVFSVLINILLSHTIHWLYWDFPNLEQIFPKWEIGGEGEHVLFIRVSSGKNSRLTLVPFWNCPEGTFHFVGRRLIEDCFSHSGCISCYRIAKYAARMQQFTRAGMPCTDPLKSANALPLRPRLYGFRNVPVMPVSSPYFPCWSFFITETEMRTFRCFENGLAGLKIPAQIQVRKKIG
jgi:hypothetical protein